MRLLSLLLLVFLVVPDALAQIRGSGTPRDLNPRARLAPTEAPAPQITGFDRGTVRTLSISGDRSELMETLMAPGDGWVYGLEIGERGDQPCYLGLWAVEADAPGLESPSVTFNRCDTEPTARSVAALGFAKAKNQEDWRRARRAAIGVSPVHIPIYSEVVILSFLLGAAFDNSDPAPPLPAVDEDPVALDGLGICQNTRNDEMKGLRIHGSRLGFDGARISTDPIVTTEAQTIAGATIPAGVRVNESFERPNCSNSDGWQSMRTCRADEVLVGVDIHYKRPGFMGNQDRMRITGLAPKCARVTIERE